MALLTDEYGINPEKLVLAPFFTEAIESYHQTEMDERRDFVVIGGFKHPPNIDQVMLLKRDIWPKYGLVSQMRSYKFMAHTPRHVFNSFMMRETDSSSMDISKIWMCHWVRLGFYLRR